MKIRTLIVDDEPLARRNIATLMSTEAQFDIVGECGDGASAIQAIRELKPHVVFLDIQMPTLSGFGVVDATSSSRPLVVFVTAHDEFAARAFEVEAFDYLLKPFRRERFRRVLDRIEKVIKMENSASAALDVHHSGDAKEASRILIKSGRRTVIVKLHQLEFIRAAANYVLLQVAEESHPIRERIGVIEAQLPSDRFLRVHRSYIVNMERVRDIFGIGGGEYMLTLRSGREIPIGSTYLPAIRVALAKLRIFKSGS